MATRNTDITVHYSLNWYVLYSNLVTLTYIQSYVYIKPTTPAATTITASVNLKVRKGVNGFYGIHIILHQNRLPG